jgi:hypothetical protein
MRATIRFLQAVPGAAANIRANLKMPLPATFISYGASSFNGYASYYEADVRAAFANVSDPALQQELLAAATAAAASMRDLAAWLNSNAGSATSNFALGADRFARMLSAADGVDTPIAQLQQIGQADLARNQAAVQAACATFAPGATITACISQVAAKKPADGPVAAAQRQIDELRAFVVANDLVTIPGNEQVLVRPSPPYRNVIYFDGPGPFETGIPSIYYIPSGSQISEPALLFTSVHEAMPGHFLQGLHANRSSSLIGRVFGTIGFRRGLGSLCRGNDVGGGAPRHRGGAARLSAERAAAQLPLPRRDRNACAGHDLRAGAGAVSAAMLSGRWHRRTSRPLAAPSIPAI